MSVVHFGEEPFAVRLLHINPDRGDAEIGEVCPLLAVEGNKGLVVRDREIFWYPLERMRVILQPEKAPEEEPTRVPKGLGGEED
jgi:hypothetical protein